MSPPKSSPWSSTTHQLLPAQLTVLPSSIGAVSYTHLEQALGEALGRHKREEYLLTDKFPVWLCESEEDLGRIFAEQLKNCGVDYFDVYLLHALSAERMEKVRRLHMLEFFTEQKRLGKIRKLGFSFHDTPEVFEQIMQSFDWDIVQIQLNYFDWEQLE